MENEYLQRLTIAKIQISSLMKRNWRVLFFANIYGKSQMIFLYRILSRQLFVSSLSLSLNQSYKLHLQHSTWKIKMIRSWSSRRFVKSNKKKQQNILLGKLSIDRVKRIQKIIQLSWRGERDGADDESWRKAPWLHLSYVEHACGHQAIHSNG